MDLVYKYNLHEVPATTQLLLSYATTQLHLLLKLLNELHEITLILLNELHSRCVH